MKLFIDSSTNYLYLSLYEHNQEIDSLVRDGKNKHSETIIDYLKAFLLKNNLCVDDLDSVFVGRGPGSYTGVRISGTIAKVLALVKNLKLYSFSSLDLMMVSNINNDGKFLVRIIAKKNHSYYKLASIVNQQITFESSDTFSHDEVLKPLKEYKIIDVSEEVLNTKNLSTYLFKQNLYKEEDVFQYVPNYLRSEMNG
ncbi:MAG: tRNA (adenosine(37)-N6)-threonylcarbamoyltransferase complex dimerization subunit type 1 TsaB [Bacilli bacterium]